MFASILICADVVFGTYLRFVFVRMYMDSRSTHAIVFHVVSELLALAVSKFNGALPL